MIYVYGIGNCDTIRKTLTWLVTQEIPYRFHDYRKQGIDRALLVDFMTRFTLDELINKRGTTWRKLPEQSRLNLSPETALQLMLENPAIIRRPILTDGSHWLIGFDPQAVLQTLTG